jgi:2-isopropylmalate synthase
MAGAVRVEGTLFGNGERTGNMDIITMAMNLYSQGVEPQLDMSSMAEIARTYQQCTHLPVHARHPYVGELVYTAFSGSHQDAIRKGMKHYKEGEYWEVPYLSIDPRDLGRRYEEVVRINSQSGKGGVTHVLERDFGISIPRWMQQDFSAVVQAWSERTSTEVTPQRIWELFQEHYASPADPWRMQSYNVKRMEDVVRADMVVGSDKATVRLQGHGHGVVEALVDALERQRGIVVEVEAFDEHALTTGTDADALACIRVRVGDTVGRAAAFAEDTTSATLQAVLTAVDAAMAASTVSEDSLVATSA